MNKEIWKKIPDYPDYEVSSLGRVKSLKFGKERILKQPSRGNYLCVNLCKNGVYKAYDIHILMSICFYHHKPNRDILVDHKNNNKLDNRLENLQLLPARDNLEKAKEGGFSSKYNGVIWHKPLQKWRARPYDKDLKKGVHLGYFNTQEEARIAVENYFRTKDL